MHSTGTDESSSYPTIELDEVDSTNVEALRRAGRGARGPMWISARRQTAGRGRSGRRWISEPHNLAATLLMVPGCGVGELHQLSLVTGVAVHDALAEVAAAGGETGSPPKPALLLKWPNDVLANGAKLGGILIESTTIGGEAVAVIGIGINVAAAPHIDGKQTIALADLGIATASRELLAAVDRHLRRWCVIWANGQRFDLVREAWLERAHRPGAAISVHTGNATHHGLFAGIDETGALLVDSVPGQSNTLRRFTFGDVSLVAPQDPEGNAHA